MIKKIYRRFLQKLYFDLNDISRNEPVFPESKNIKVGPNFIIGKYRNIHIEDGAVLEIDENVGLREFCNIIVLKGATLKIGKYVFCNNYSSINCLGKITIGDYSLIGEGVKMYDHMHEYTYNKDIGVLTVERTEFKTGEINIGKNVWIASNSIILKGVTIGDNVMIGANNLIYKSVPPNTTIKAKTDTIVDYFGSK